MPKKKTKTNNKAKNKSTDKKNVFLHDERVKVIFGLFLIFLAAYLTLAFISYFFTWKIDQSFEWGKSLSSAEITVENWTGKTGAKFANLFINKLFGLASFAIPLILTIYGLAMLKIKLVNLNKFTRITIIATILLSLSLGFIFGNMNGYLGSGLGGNYGFLISSWLNAFIGKIGTGLLLCIAIFSFIIFSFPSTYAALRKWYYYIAGKAYPLQDMAFEDEQDTITGNKDENTELDNETNDEPVFETEINNNEQTNTDYSAYKASLEDEIEKNDNKVQHEQDDSEEDVELTVEKAETEEDNSQYEDNYQDAANDYDPTLELSQFMLPPLDLLEKHESNNFEVSDEELISNKNKIVETFANFKIQINKIKATIGPTVTLYEIVPAPGIRISKIKNLEDDIALSLAALGIRIIAPIPGKGTIGIEVPNQHPQIVSMRSILNSRNYQEGKHELPMALGKTISNESFVVDLTKMPHLLVAGATGQGKSVGLNAILTSLLYKKHPSTLKFVLVDPKKVELSIYSKIEKHYLAKMPDDEEAIITDTQKVINTLNSLTVKMDERYNLLKAAKVRNLKEYNSKFISRKLNPEKGHHFMPYIVVIIDEFADLIMTAGKEVEGPIARLAQLARAVGIHLIIATQRPTTNIITGVIKANFPARIAFKVSSMIDSRTILDSPGANQLIGRGDMLITSGNDLIRLQCAYIDVEEIDKLTEFIGQQQSYPSAMLLPEYKSEESEDIGEVDLSKKDGLFDEAAKLVVLHQQGSTSLIQRKFSIGYNRAGRIIDQLEAAGIVGPFEGSKARQVLIPDEYTLEKQLNNL
jgi:S-DNA-T family DNA segregation ATPase FtsK/SpoIIIE